MRIMHVIDSLAQGGAERMAVDLANAAVRDGHEVAFTVTRQDTLLARDLDSRVRLHRLGRTRRFDIGALRRFAALTRAAESDVVHAHGRSSFSFTAAARVVTGLSTPALLHDQFGTIHLGPAVPIWLRGAGRLYLEAYVATSPSMRPWARSAGIADRHIYVIPNASNFDRLSTDARVDVRALFGIDARETVGVFVGGLRPVKGLDRLIEALTRIVGAPPFRLLIVGGERDPAYVRDCRAQAARLGVEKQLIFTGERDDVPALLRSVDFAVIASRSETGPIILMEMMYAGLPFVSTRCGQVVEQIEPLGAEGIVALNDTAALADGLLALLRLSPEARRSRGSVGIELATRLFDIRNVMPRWYAVYEQMMREARR